MAWAIFNHVAAAAAKSLQSCPTLCDPIDGSPPGSPVPGILQARKLEWVAISFSSGWKCKVKGKSLSRVRLSATPWTAAYQAPQSTGFSRQKYWSGVPSLLRPRCGKTVFSRACRITLWREAHEDQAGKGVRASCKGLKDNTRELQLHPSMRKGQQSVLFCFVWNRDVTTLIQKPESGKWQGNSFFHSLLYLF